MSSDEQRLRDIVACAREISEYLQGQRVHDFEEDRMRQRAVERLLLMIGDAAKHLGRETRAAIPQPWSEIIRLRDKGIHAYDSLTPRLTFAIANESVPALARAAEDYLRGLTPP